MTVSISVTRACIRGMHRMPRMTLAGAALIAGLFVVAGPAADALVYDRAAILGGEIPRLLTGHLVHLDARHLFFNAGAFVMLGAAYESSGSLRLGRLMLGAMAAISAVLFLLTPETAVYCGLSAALNALYSALLVALWRDTRHWLWPLLLAGGLIKIGWEWHFGPVVNGALAWPPHYGAHLTGFLFGVAFETVLRRPAPDPQPAAPDAPSSPSSQSRKARILGLFRRLSG